MSKIVVDTNCLLDNPELLLDLENEYAISYTTLQELDKLKGNPDLSYPARMAIKLIFQRYKENAIEILNVPTANETNDEKIVQDAKDIEGMLMSQDIGALVVAEARGVPTVDLNKVDKEYDRHFKGYHEATVPDKYYYSLTQNRYQHAEIEEALEIVLPMNSYLVLYPTEVGTSYLVFRKRDTGYLLVPPSTKNLRAASGS